MENILKFIKSVESFLKRGAISFPPRPAPHTWHGGARFAWGSACSQSGPREGRRLACPVEPVIPNPSDETPASGPHRPAGGAQVCRGPALFSGTALGRSEGRQVSDRDPWLGAEPCLSRHREWTPGLLLAADFASAASAAGLCRRRGRLPGSLSATAPTLCVGISTSPTTTFLVSVSLFVRLFGQPHLLMQLSERPQQ